MRNRNPMKITYAILLFVELLLMAVLFIRHLNITDIVLLVLCISAAHSAGIAAAYIVINGDCDD